MSTTTPAFIAAYNRQVHDERRAVAHEYGLANYHPGTTAYCEEARTVARWYQGAAEAAETCADQSLVVGLEDEAEGWSKKARKMADAAAHYARESGRGRTVPTRKSSARTAADLRGFLPSI